MWVATERLPRSPGHPFYERLNQVLVKAGFDAFVEKLCARFFAERLGRPSLRLGRYFRLLLVGYFEGLNSERAIAWRVSDSASVRAFLEYEPEEAPPSHSTLSRTRRRIDVETHGEVFTWVLKQLAEAGLKGTVAREGDSHLLSRDRICKRLEKTPPYNLEAFFGTGGTPGRFDTPDDVPQPIECLPPALPADLDVIRLGVGGPGCIRSGQADHEQAVVGAFGRASHAAWRSRPSVGTPPERTTRCNAVVDDGLRPAPFPHGRVALGSRPWRRARALCLPAGPGADPRSRA